MTLREIVYESIKTVRGGGKISKDERFNERLIAKKYNALRGAYIASNGLYAVNNPLLVQDLGCLTLSECDVSECRDLPYGLLIKKVVAPRPVGFPSPCQGEGYSYVGSIRKTMPYQFARPEDIESRQASYFGRHFNWYYQIGGTIYIRFKKEYEDTEKVNVRMIASDPTQVCYTGNDDVTQCFDWDNTQYPVDDSTHRAVFERLMQVDFSLMLQTPEDVANDGKSV